MDRVQLAKLLDELSAMKRELDRLVFDEEYPHELGQPCSPQQIAALEATVGRPLPPSYRAFMELHNGWSDFAGGAKLLAVEDHRAVWVAERVKSLGFLFQEFEPRDAFKHGAIPILLGKKDQSFMVLDPSTVRPDGEMDFISFHLTQEEHRFDSFFSFLLHDADLTRRLIEQEKKGTRDDKSSEE